jgi:hypothetical protein
VFVRRREYVYENYRRTFGECGFAAGGLTGNIAGCLGETAESRAEGGRKEGRKEGGWEEGRRE